MNHLAHFLLSASDPALLVGGFLGDFVKGRLNGRYPHDIENGIKLHRAIDAFTDRHPIVRQSCLRPDNEFRRVAPIMMDIIYDYFLAQHWHKFREDSLEQFSDHVSDTILNYDTELPASALSFISYLAAHKSLKNYGTREFVQRSFEHLNKRLTRKNPLNVAFTQFVRFEPALEQDFLSFFPELQHFTETWRQANQSNSQQQTCQVADHQ